jgi:hypothetical protein
MTDRIQPQGAPGPEPEDVPDGDDPGFIERIARPLRARERLDVTFEARVMSAVNAESRAGHKPGAARSPMSIRWWSRPRTFRVSPAAALAWAAAFTGIVLLSAHAARTLAGRNQPRATQAAITRAALDTVHVVRFVFVDPTAEAVSLVGDFNGWSKGATQLEPAGPQGTWSVSLALPPGRHEYAFIVEGPAGERWAADPFAALVRDEFDTESSVLVLPGEQRSTS